ncbi:hypothetical protein GCM10010387_23510 [Streptomyces inusitatus]|uniref:Uncharacterized protein n=1 Tax=Streptomyces inusitatus TaxID=68221 RepID=A0A918Q0T4_9ACTN|nr:hypothetical protein [Streptomyces inusitatus]GGZ29431.1 hypothetical protein GCM10010387_23510 [Streptomyces inusitatus]
MGQRDIDDPAGRVVAQERLAPRGGPDRGRQDLGRRVDADEGADAGAEIAEDPVGAAGLQDDDGPGGTGLPGEPQGGGDRLGDGDAGQILDQDHIRRAGAVRGAAGRKAVDDGELRVLLK